MRQEAIIAIIAKLVQDYVSEAVENSDIQSKLRGPRGFQGSRGEDGIPFIWEDHKEKIHSLIKDAALKFSDLTEEEIESLKGPKGEKGDSGKPFIFEENKENILGAIHEEIERISPNLKLKFSDLTEEEISALRGPKGRDGKDGISFIFEEHKDKIYSLISDELKNISSQLKLKFTDLTIEEKESLRGPRGQRGKPGKDFVFDEHKEFFESLKLKFSDLSTEEIESLKLKFSDLSTEEIESLKLKFSDLTEDQKLELRGPRGQRGKQGLNGIDGKDGKDGQIGPMGPRGIPGISGISGKNGKDGKDGKDAPVIVDIEFEEYPKDQIALRTELSDGTIIETNKIDLPKKLLQPQVVAVAMGGGGSVVKNTWPFTRFSCGRIENIDFDSFSLIDCFTLPIVYGTDIKFDLGVLG